MLQDDILCLASVLEDEDLTRGYLAAEGYGARICHLEPDRSTSGNVCKNIETLSFTITFHNESIERFLVLSSP